MNNLPNEEEFPTKVSAIAKITLQDFALFMLTSVTPIGEIIRIYTVHIDLK